MWNVLRPLIWWPILSCYHHIGKQKYPVDTFVGWIEGFWNNGFPFNSLFIITTKKSLFHFKLKMINAYCIKYKRWSTKLLTYSFNKLFIGQITIIQKKNKWKVTRSQFYTVWHTCNSAKEEECKVKEIIFLSSAMYIYIKLQRFTHQSCDLKLLIHVI